MVCFRSMLLKINCKIFFFLSEIAVKLYCYAQLKITCSGIYEKFRWCERPARSITMPQCTAESLRNPFHLLLMPLNGKFPPEYYHNLHGAANIPVWKNTVRGK